ncbi:hypothetical protein G6F24_017393 [Rhizopus arrhizus]|nr:hypothetical protein G6F24_017393 [Rhizopus arrhizus]
MPRRAGVSSRRSSGTIGNTWSIAHTSGIDSNTLKLTNSGAHARRGRWRRTDRRCAHAAAGQSGPARSWPGLRRGSAVLPGTVPPPGARPARRGSRAGGGSPPARRRAGPARGLPAPLPLPTRWRSAPRGARSSRGRTR